MWRRDFFPMGRFLYFIESTDENREGLYVSKAEYIPPRPGFSGVPPMGAGKDFGCPTIQRGPVAVERQRSVCC
jgi:hypothetical protein